MLENKEHHISINNNPIYDIKCIFFLNKKDAQSEVKIEKEKWLYKSELSKISIRQVDGTVFDWFNITKHTSISNGIEKEFFYLRGDLNKKNPSTGKPIFVEQYLNLEEGQAIADYLNKWKEK